MLSKLDKKPIAAHVGVVKVATQHPKIIIANVAAGDVFSEISHYRYLTVDPMKGHAFTHLETGETIFLTTEYTENMLATADQYDHEELVGREDKLWTAKQIAAQDHDGHAIPRVGDVRVMGIRSLFENIYNSEVFACCFKKQDVPISDKAYKEAVATQLKAAVDVIMEAQKNRTGVANAALEEIRKVQENPIVPIKPGEDRILRGYKVQFTSRDGRYDCVDMDIDTSKGETNVRPVNINTLEWLVYKGVKYIVEK